jgi:hypothetical protein
LTRLRAALRRCRHRDQIGRGHIGEKAMLFEDEAFQVSHVLNRHVPAMSDGFAIVTKYGEMEVRGQDALKVQALVLKMYLAKARILERAQARSEGQSEA